MQTTNTETIDRISDTNKQHYHQKTLQDIIVDSYYKQQTTKTNLLKPEIKVLLVLGADKLMSNLHSKIKTTIKYQIERVFLYFSG